MRKGFTLIEILVVMAIISVMVGMVGGNFLTSRLRSRDAERKNALSQISKALELYYNDYNKYAESINGQVNGIGWGNTFIDANNTVYMKQIPSDSRAPSQQYYYETDSTQTKYRLYTRLENEQDLDTDLDGDGNPGNEYDGSVGDGGAKSCGTKNCNFGLASPNSNMTEIYN